jgi:hypothetical protein
MKKDCGRIYPENEAEPRKRSKGKVENLITSQSHRVSQIALKRVN